MEWNKIVQIFYLIENEANDKMHVDDVDKRFNKITFD